MEKGGLYDPAPMRSLDDVILKPIMEIMREYYMNNVREKEAHRETLQLLTQVISGEVAGDTVLVTPDGWEIKAERPQADLDVKTNPERMGDMHLDGIILVESNRAALDVDPNILRPEPYDPMVQPERQSVEVTGITPHQVLQLYKDNAPTTLTQEQKDGSVSEPLEHLSASS